MVALLNMKMYCPSCTTSKPIDEMKNIECKTCWLGNNNRTCSQCKQTKNAVEIGNNGECSSCSKEKRVCYHCNLCHKVEHFRGKQRSFSNPICIWCESSYEQGYSFWFGDELV